MQKEIQATAISYQKRAVLITGPAGVGKTTLALRLIEHGAILIGDDVVNIFIKNNRLYCKSQEKLKGIIELRELGLVGGLKVAQAAPVLCMIRLHQNPMERLPRPKTISLLSKKIPVFDFYACNATEIRVLYTLRVLLGKNKLEEGITCIN